MNRLGSRLAITLLHPIMLVGGFIIVTLIMPFIYVGMLYKHLRIVNTAYVDSWRGK